MKRILNFLREFFRRPSEAELIADGIVPTGRRYDRELVEKVQNAFHGGFPQNPNCIWPGISGQASAVFPGP